MFSFKPNEKITNKNYLFGRNKNFQQLDSIHNLISVGTNCQLQGEKRFGKTSILNCLFEELNNSKKGSYLPFVLDFKSNSGYKGTANVFRFIISKMVSDLSKLGFLEKEMEIRGINLKPNKVLEACYSDLKNLEDFRMQGLFEEFVLEFSKQLEASFIFLIDEYEYLMAKSLDSPEGFASIRNLSEYPRDQKYKPLTYVISGSKSWEILCTKIGSPELNNQGASITYVGAIEKEDFENMLDFYYQDFTNVGDYSLLQKDELYLLSGGIPYYAKKIGETIVTTNKKEISYQILKNDFDSVFSNLEENEIKILYQVIKADKIKEKNAVYNLIDRGILRDAKNNIEINGRLFKDFISDKFSNKDYFLQFGQLYSTETFVEEIFTLIERINRNYRNQGKGDYLFEPTVSENSQRISMKKSSNNFEEFKSFVNTIYAIVFERTASGGQKKFRIDKKYKECDFIKRIDSLRQELHHLTDSKSYEKRKNQFDRGNIFKFYIGKKQEPTLDDLVTFQINLLKDFKQFLVEIDSLYS